MKSIVRSSVGSVIISVVLTHRSIRLVINCSFGYDVHAVLRQVGSLQRPCTAAQKGGLWKHPVSKTTTVHFMVKH